MVGVFAVSFRFTSFFIPVSESWNTILKLESFNKLFDFLILAWKLVTNTAS